MTLANGDNWSHRVPPPPGWQCVPLGEVGEIVSGVTLGRKLRDSRTHRIPYLRVANVKDAHLDLSDVYEIEASEDEIDKLRLRVGDLLLTEGGDADKLGRGTLWRGELPLCIHQNHIFRVRFDTEQFWPEFIAAQVASPYGKGYFLRHAKQTTGIATINQRVLAGFPLIAPSFTEQQRIASTLREQLAAVERARDAAEARLEGARALQDSYLRTVFATDAARQWPVKPLGAFAEIVGGLQKTPERAPKVLHRPYLTVRNVQRGHVDLSEVERFEVTKEELNRLRLLDGDILVVEGNGSVDQIGRNAVFSADGQEWIHQNHIIRVRLPREVSLYEFVSIYLNSDQGKSQMIKKAQTTSGLYTLSVGKVESLEVPCPPIPEQRKLMTELSRRMGAVKQVAAALEQQEEAINALPAALLARAFRGEL